MTCLDMTSFESGLAKCEEKDPEGVSLRRKSGEKDRDYRKRLEDFRVLIFILQAKTPEEVRRGIPKGDGTFKKITLKKVCELFSKAPDLLEGVQSKGLLSGNALIGNINSYKEADTGEYFLF